MVTLFTTIGFILAGYSVIANDSVQTLGTWIASNRERFKWTTLWAAAASVLVFTLVYGWYTGDGDISFGRLNKIAYIEPKWYHALAPLALVLLTRKGIPVSTSFLVLSAFASTFVLEKMLMKSVAGYGVAAVVAYVLWLGIARLVNEKEDVSEKAGKFWRVFQWFSTGFLWFTWLSHDVANIAVFLLLYFKGMNDIPMSTTWVFVGLLCGRELALNTGLTKKGNLKTIFPIVAKDFLKLIVGLTVSVTIVLAIHYGTEQGQVGTPEGMEETAPTEQLDAPAPAVPAEVPAAGDVTSGTEAGTEAE